MFGQIPVNSLAYPLAGVQVIAYPADAASYGVLQPGATSPNSQLNSSATPAGISGTTLLGIAVVLWFLFR